MQTQRLIHTTLKSRCFERLLLGPNDALSQDIELVLAFDYHIDPMAFHASLDHSLDAFPHLTGQLHKNELWSIDPYCAGIRLEIAKTTVPISFHNLEQFTLAQHRSEFFTETHQSDKIGKLLSIRMTLVGENMTVMGIRVSHAVVDGTGLALFLHHCTAAMREIKPLEVIHDRFAGCGTTKETTLSTPHGYHEANTSSSYSDPLAQQASEIFSIEISNATLKFPGKSLLDTRLRLSAWLCAELASFQPSFSEVAVWCDPRGLNGIPKNYTGNSGCYIHFPLDGDSAENLTTNMRSLATRHGFSRIAETDRQIQLADKLDHPLAWDNQRSNILQLNLVPHAAESANFGAGAPVFGLMLSRNSSGLRISVTPDGTRYLIEACLDETLGVELFHACHNHGLAPKLWCTGHISPETSC